MFRYLSDSEKVMFQKVVLPVVAISLESIRDHIEF
jgi:hypothetical protein